ncbi:MAG TPA: glycyl radical protein [Anaerohalosphaeraceae bacterium]|jgi:formate C-acetyltransferase|nr:glycyl radical protein [Anaerohalosphaeraceae bacterium]
MNERVAKLRRQSVATKPYISSERAELATDFYQSGITLEVSPPVARALCLHHITSRKQICINDGELIVGERGPAPKATYTYPELCCHSLEDFEVMIRRTRTSFDVSEEVKKVYADKIIPFWKGKTMREKVFAAMDKNWQKAFEAGVFTEFMEQRAPGHAILDDKIYHRGLLDLQDDIADSLRNLDILNDPQAHSKQQELCGMNLAIEAILTLARRYSEKAEQLAALEKDPKRQKELREIAAVCRHVPAHPPQTFRQALQMYWFIHLGVITDLNVWDSYNPGRLDQHLYPFYKKELEAGTLTREQARELLQCFWIKFNNQPAPPKVGITEQQSGTYTDFSLINVGGVDPHTGQDAVNEVSYLILEVVEEMQLVQPSCCIQISAKNPDHFVKRACQVIRTGLGQPSVFNTDVIIREMLHDGKTMFDARSGGPSGCVEISAFGKESCTLTGYCNWPKIFELALHNGKDPRTGIQIGPKTGDAAAFTAYEQLRNAYQTQLRYFIDVKIRGNNLIERLYAKWLPAPFLSVLVDDCIACGRDYHNGGPRYNTTYIQGVGIGTLADAMTAVRYHVFDQKTITMSTLLDALSADFQGHEALQKQLSQSPRYGNDDDYADAAAVDAFNMYYDAVNGRPNTKGGKYRVNLLPTTVHVYFGQVTGALPHGRKAGAPLSDGISPSQGGDLHGPTAVIKSAAKIDHARTGGTLLNMKFNPQVMEGEGLEKLVHLIRSYFRLDGHHIQFNVVSRQTLLEARKNPQQHRDLIVRVAGYSDYFIELGEDLQNEIISRTEQASF